MYTPILGRFLFGIYVSIICWSCEPVKSSPEEVTLDHVKDGDSFTILHQNQLQDIRIAYIDCPEHDQPFAKEAYQFAKEQLNSGKILIYPVDVDKYKRWVCIVEIARNKDTIDLGDLLVQEGYAWHYTAYSDDDLLDSLERAARRGRKGLWRNDSAIPPWKYRKLVPASH